MNNIDSNTGEIVMYQPDETIRLEVRVENETVWLTQQQMADLFLTTRNNITLHIGNIFKEGELVETSVRKDSLLTATDGKKYRTKIYNLDVIISVGYRVNHRQLHRRDHVDDAEQARYQSLCHHLHTPTKPATAVRCAAT